MQFPIHSSSVFLKICFFPQSFPTAPPTFAQAPPPIQEALVGSHLSLECVAHGNPSPTITWLKDGRVIQGTNNQVCFFICVSVWVCIIPLPVILNLNIPSKDAFVSHCELI